MRLEYVKALHIIFVVTWFAGLFYLPRLYIYHIEAAEKEEPDRSILTRQFIIMETKLWNIITWPSMILALLFGIWMLVLMPVYLSAPWMHLKLAFVVGLVFYHFYCYKIFNQLKRGFYKYSSLSMRFINEGATVFLIAIVFIVVTKNLIGWIGGLVGILGVAGLLTFAILRYKKIRDKDNPYN